MNIGTIMTACGTAVLATVAVVGLSAGAVQYVSAKDIEFNKKLHDFGSRMEAFENNQKLFQKDVDGKFDRVLNALEKLQRSYSVPQQSETNDLLSRLSELSPEERKALLSLLKSFETP